MAISYEPVRWRFNKSGTTFAAYREAQAASKTFLAGAPLELVSGNAQEADFGGADVIIGFATEEAHNLDAADTAQGSSVGTPINQASAITEPIGGRTADGKIGVARATADAVFSAMLKDGQVFTQALVIPGTFYKLEKDSTSGFWFIDSLDTSGNDSICDILGLDDSSPNTVAGGARVYFQIKPTQRPDGI